MDYFDEEEEKSQEDKESELFEKKYEQQMKLIKKVWLAAFGISGGMFLIIGILLYALYMSADGFNIGFVFIPLGLFLLLLGIILYAVVPTKGNYERYKKNLSRYDYMEPMSLSIKSQLLESRIAYLENKIEALEKKLENLERRR